MADQMTTTGSLGGGRKEPVSAVDDAIEALRQAMLDEGQDPGSVEAKLHAAMPNVEGGNLVGNFADLQRMGAIALTGVMPTPPGEEDVETDDITEAFVAVAGSEGEGEAAAAPAEAEADTRTKAEIQAELDAAGIAWNAGDTKADLIARLEEG